MIALFRASVIALCLSIGFGPAFAGSMMTMGVGAPQASAGPPAYTFIGEADNAGSGTTISHGFALGSNPTCTVVASVADAGGAASPTITVSVGGVSLVQDNSKGDATVNRFSAVFSKPLASCSGTQTLSLSASAAANLTVWVYVLTGLSSSTVVATGGYIVDAGVVTPPTPTIAVTTGDFMFVVGNGTSVPSYTNFAQVPTVRSGFDGLASAADQTITSTNASFALTPNGNDQVVTVATYH